MQCSKILLPVVQPAEARQLAAPRLPVSAGGVAHDRRPGQARVPERPVVAAAAGCRGDAEDAGALGPSAAAGQQRQQENRAALHSQHWSNFFTRSSVALSESTPTLSHSDVPTEGPAAPGT